MSKTELLGCFTNLRSALDKLDLDEMDTIMDYMLKYDYGEEESELFRKLKNAVDEIDSEACEEVLQQWESKLWEIKKSRR